MKKRSIIAMMLATCVFVNQVSMADAVSTANTSSNYIDVEISENNFPDKNLREVLSVVYDKNRDNKISAVELDEKSRTLQIDSFGGGYQVIDYKYIKSCEDASKLVSDLTGIERLNLKVLSVFDNNGLKSVDLSRCDSLEEVYIEKVKNLREVKLGSNVTNLDLNRISLKSYDFSKQTRLKRVHLSALGNKKKTVKLPTKNLIDLKVIACNNTNFKFLGAKSKKRVFFEFYGTKLKKLDLKKFKNIYAVHLTERPRIGTIDMRSNTAKTAMGTSNKKELKKVIVKNKKMIKKLKKHNGKGVHYKFVVKK
ncbi:MAG: hypothetical protein K6G63_06715 [Eubacterium sp.]|nr:hypothetical protein [Eubacterium sp.]